jgi:hypothetical protein
MYPPRYKREGICKKCGAPFIKKAANQVFCPGCSYWKHFEGGHIRGRLILAEPRLKMAADESGNPRIWTSDRYSQKFLRSLIPEIDE